MTYITYTCGTGGRSGGDTMVRVQAKQTGAARPALAAQRTPIATTKAKIAKAAIAATTATVLPKSKTKATTLAASRTSRDACL